MIEFLFRVVDAEAAAVAEKMAIAEMRRLPPTEGGMSFKVGFGAVGCGTVRYCSSLLLA